MNFAEYFYIKFHKVLAITLSTLVAKLVNVKFNSGLRYILSEIIQHVYLEGMKLKWTKSFCPKTCVTYYLNIFLCFQLNRVYRKSAIGFQYIDSTVSRFEYVYYEVKKYKCLIVSDSDR